MKANVRRKSTRCSWFAREAWIGTLTLSLGGLIAANSTAAPINYGDFSGSTVVFKQVTEDSATDAVPLFGAPTVAGNSLDFNPIGFASSSSGGSTDNTTGVLTFDIDANPGNFISMVKIAESGDYNIFGTGGLGTEATVSAAVFIDVIEVDGVGVAGVNGNANLVFTPSDGDYNLQDDGFAIAAIFEGILDYDVEQLLIDEGVSFVNGATKVRVELNNVLTTTSESGSQSFIQKKDFDGMSVTIVPEPGTLALAGAGIGLTLTRRRQAA